MHTVKWILAFLSQTNNSIYYKSFVYTQWSGYKYCYVSQTIQLNSYLFTQRWSNSSISNYSI